MLDIKKLREKLEAEKKSVQDAQTAAGQARIKKLVSEINAASQSYFDKVASHEKVLSEAKEAESIAEEFSKLGKKVSGEQEKQYIREAKVIRRQSQDAIQKSKELTSDHCGRKFAECKKSFQELNMIVSWTEIDDFSVFGEKMIQLILSPAAHYSMISKPKVANNQHLQELAKKFNSK